VEVTDVTDVTDRVNDKGEISLDFPWYRKTNRSGD